MINRLGYKTQFSQVYSNDDPNLETDVQFGVTGTWYTLDHRFVIEPGDSSLPTPPITGKATDGVPVSEILERTP
jgi:catechol 1,2-dioxygenase